MTNAAGKRSAPQWWHDRYSSIAASRRHAAHLHPGRPAPALVQPKGALGFGYSRIYWQFIPPDGSADTLIVELTELPEAPDLASCESLMEVCRHLLDEMPQCTRVALLYARPGGGPLSSADRVWGRSLTAAARHRGVPMWPIHFANDESLCVLAPDDLTESA